MKLPLYLSISSARRRCLDATHPVCELKPLASSRGLGMGARQAINKSQPQAARGLLHRPLRLMPQRIAALIFFL